MSLQNRISDSINWIVHWGLKGWVVLGQTEIPWQSLKLVIIFFYGAVIPSVLVCMIVPTRSYCPAIILE